MKVKNKSKRARQRPLQPVLDAAEPATKPPLGIIPEWLWREKRMWEIICALHLYSEAMRDIPSEWLEELHSRLGEVLARNRMAEPEARSH